MKKLKLLIGGLLFAAIFALPAHAQKISDLENDSVETGEPAAASDPQITQIGDWGVICDAKL